MTKDEWIEFLESVSLYEFANIASGLENGGLSVEEAAEQLALLGSWRFSRRSGLGETMAIKMKRAEVAIATAGGPKMVKALVAGGLALTPYGNGGAYHVTHVASGKACSPLATHTHARGTLERFLSLGIDWTQPLDVIEPITMARADELRAIYQRPQD